MMRVPLLLAGYLTCGCGRCQSSAECSLHPGHDRHLCQDNSCVLVKNVFVADTVDEPNKA